MPLVFEPNSDIYLLNTPLNDYENQLDFASAAAQSTYFLSCLVGSYSDCTYQRKDGYIRLNANIETLYNCNYVMYQNNNFSNKWFYGFIRRMEYVNSTTTNIYIETDVFQTWLFDWTLRPCMIERQHTNSDTIGEFCEAEPIQAKAYAVDRIAIGDLSFGANPTQNPIIYFSKLPSAALSHTPQGIRFNSGAYTMQYANIYNDISDTDLTADLQALETAGELDLINDVGMGMYHDNVVTQVSFRDVTFATAPFQPKNNKSYLYCYGRLVGQTEYKITVQEMQKLTANIGGELWWGSSPFCYAKITEIPNCIVEYRAFPDMSVLTSTYENAINRKIAETKNTLAGNSILQAAQSLINLRPGAALSSITGISENLNILDLYNQRTNAEVEPDKLSGYSAPAAGFMAGSGGIWLIRYAPKPEEFKKIDNFFSMFGYSINQIKTPYFKNRSNWDYIKTINADISAPIPENDIKIIKGIFNNGVTVWHKPQYFGDYSQLNTIV